MKEQKLTIKINRPINKVFAFTINPENTPKWIPTIKKEETETPIQVGAKYRNTSDGMVWDEYEVTQFELNRLFELQNTAYGVRYTYVPLSENETELEYFEWMKDGDLSNPLQKDLLDTLKNIIEA